MSLKEQIANDLKVILAFDDTGKRTLRYLIMAHNVEIEKGGSWTTRQCWAIAKQVKHVASGGGVPQGRRLTVDEEAEAGPGRPTCRQLGATR
jgi:hypothetical protein